MGKRIYKYEVPCKIKAKVEKWLQPNMQYNTPVIWAEINDDVEEKEWTVIPVGTGWEWDGIILNDGQYCGTVMDDPYVWHIYAF